MPESLAEKINLFAPGKAWERGKKKRRNVVLGNLS
jgi:hypothetical protein